MNTCNRRQLIKGALFYQHAIGYPMDSIQTVLDLLSCCRSTSELMPWIIVQGRSYGKLSYEVDNFYFPSPELTRLKSLWSQT